MVEQVEDLRTELQETCFFSEREVLQEREVEIVRRCSDDNVSPGSSIAACEIACETGGVEPERWIVVEVVRIADRIRASAGLCAGKLQARGRIERVAGLDRDDSVGLPAA